MLEGHDSKPVIVIIGPTAGGKTALAVELALALRHEPRPRGLLGPGEVISADSMLVYRGLNIGSAKPTEDERRGVPHHCIDVAEPTDAFTVHDWLDRANRAIDEIHSRGGTPIVVGGTHLYVKALIDGLFEGPEPDEALRERLRAHSPVELHERLKAVDPATAARLHVNDTRRAIRALEVYELTGKPISAMQTQWAGDGSSFAEGSQAPEGSRPGPKHRFIVVTLDWPVELVNPRINARVKDMLARGLLDEVRDLYEAKKFGPQSREGLGYKQLIAFLDRQMKFDEACEAIKIETRRFAKNQRTWAKRFRGSPGALTLPATGEPGEQAVWPARVLAHTVDILSK